MSNRLLLMMFATLASLLQPLGCPAHAQDAPTPAFEQLGPDSLPQPGVPAGKITTGLFRSQLFPNTIREYSVYVPAAYDGTQPACLMVFQDGHAYADLSGQFRVPTVFDNLIHRGEMPATVAVFVNPGHSGDPLPANRWSASNRSFEYDTLSDQYARVLQQELIPHVQRELQLNLSTDPEDRALCGISSGGICAFTAAWEHPEWFRKVLSHVGSFTNIRGGHNCETLIRKTEKRPLRVFLQAGENDLDNEHGNWWLANQQMQRALQFRGYDHRFVGGQGGHNGRHGGAILPDSLRWLWRDHVVGGTQLEQTKVEAADAYAEKSIVFTGGEYRDETFRYRLLKPLTTDQPLPLVVFLHGAGERGTDNRLQLLYLPDQLAQPRWRQRFPCYVLAPQCRPDRKWMNVDWSAPGDPEMPKDPSDQLQVVLQMIQKTIAEEQIDRSRIYLTGLSMGGFGSFDLAIRHPDLFAAVAPICGAADPSQVGRLKDHPLWIVHGDQDQAVPVERSRSAAAALRKAGGNPTYVELPGVGHNSWNPAYNDEDGLLPWLFRQRRAAAVPETR
jgi:predicted peptidase